MSDIPIALQLYSVRDACAQDMMQVLQQVAAMGYDGVEFAGFHDHDAGDLAQALDRLGLKCAGTHTHLAQLDDANIQKTLEDHHTLQARYVTVPGLPEANRANRDAWLDSARQMTAAHQKLQQANLQAGFHCHFHDLAPVDETGESGWDIVAQHTPDSFVMQFDTANAMQSGSDPVAPLRQYPGRAELVHLKEYAGGHGKAILGQGDVPWHDVFDACQTVGGTQWYIIEFERSADGSDPLLVAEKCVANLRKLLG